MAFCLSSMGKDLAGHDVKTWFTEVHVYPPKTVNHPTTRLVLTTLNKHKAKCFASLDDVKNKKKTLKVGTWTIERY